MIHLSDIDGTIAEKEQAVKPDQKQAEASTTKNEQEPTLMEQPQQQQQAQALIRRAFTHAAEKPSAEVIVFPKAALPELPKLDEQQQQSRRFNQDELNRQAQQQQPQF